MRAIILVLIILFSKSINGQDSTNKVVTKIGKVFINTGTVLKKEFIGIYNNNQGKGLFMEFYPLEVDILNVTDAANGKVFSGLKLENNRSAFIDIEEIPGLIKFIELLSNVENEKPINYTEYVFNCKDMSLYSFYAKSGFGKNSILKWQYGIQTDKYYTDSRKEIDLKTLRDIRDAIINNKDKFQQKLDLY